MAKASSSGWTRRPSAIGRIARPSASAGSSFSAATTPGRNPSRTSRTFLGFASTSSIPSLTSSSRRYPSSAAIPRARSANASTALRQTPKSPWPPSSFRREAREPRAPSEASSSRGEGSESTSGSPSTWAPSARTPPSAPAIPRRRTPPSATWKAPPATAASSSPSAPASASIGTSTGPSSSRPLARPRARVLLRKTVSDRGLTEVALPDLEALLRLIERERIRPPATGAALASDGVEDIFEHLGALARLDSASLQSFLRIAIAERRHRPVPRVDLVWTGPEALVSTARDTLVVVRELFENAQKSVLIGGYAFDHGKDIFAPLHKVMVERGVETTIFLNAVEGFLEKNWPFGEPLPEIYFDPRTAEPESRFSLHAKCIVVDESRALVTSANFTDRGQTRNIEMGVLVDDPGLATRLVHQWRGLIESGLVTKA